MLLVALLAVGIVLSFLLVRYLPLIIRLGALMLLALVMVCLWLIAWPIVGPVRWVSHLHLRGAEKHASAASSTTLPESSRHIPHSG